MARLISKDTAMLYYGPHAHCGKCGTQASFIWDRPDAYQLPLICRYCRED